MFIDPGNVHLIRRWREGEGGGRGVARAKFYKFYMGEEEGESEIGKLYMGEGRGGSKMGFSILRSRRVARMMS